MYLPKVNILIPCYNHEKYVIKCLESVVTAYSGEIEVIICDDKSKDHSVNLIESYIASHRYENVSYVFLQNKENQGVSRTLNRCVRHASAEYIYAIASDDFLLEGGLNQAMMLMLDSQSDAVVSDCIVVDSDNLTICKSAFFEYRHASLKRLRKNIANELVFNWVVPGPALLQKKVSCIEIGGYNEKLIAEDRDYFLRLLANNKVIFNEHCIAGYRVHLNNVSRSVAYLKAASSEFSAVNYSARNSYSGLAGLYLKTYWLDLNKIPVLITTNLRKFIKAIYTLRDFYG